MRHLHPVLTSVALLAAAALVPAVAQADTELRLKAYSDLAYKAERVSGAPTTRGFAFPNLDLFALAQHERWSVVVETVFDHEMATHEVEIDVERALVQYRATNWLRLVAGRFHSATGYYNDSYHHGTYHMLTASRPLAVAFEDHGGMLPVHLIGVHADARLPLSGLGNLRFDAEAGNGRGAKPHDMGTFESSNSTALNVRVRFEPALEYTAIGANATFDTIPASVDGLASRMREWIAGVHAVVLRDPIHLIAEAYQITHSADGARYRSHGAFVELGYAIAAWQPYLRIERFRRGDDPYYRLDDETPVRDQSAILGGVKWTATEHVAVKVEGTAARLDGSSDRNLGLLTQLAYQF